MLASWPGPVTAVRRSAVPECLTAASHGSVQGAPEGPDTLWRFPKMRGPFLEVPTTRIMMYLDLYVDFEAPSFWKPSYCQGIGVYI